MYARNGGFLPLLPHVPGENQIADDCHESISMVECRSLLAENMKHKCFPSNHIVYNKGDLENHMYIINSGTIEVTTSNGSRAEQSQGDFFGEGQVAALFLICFIVQLLLGAGKVSVDSMIGK